MTSTYTCGNCGEVFRVPEGAKPRCPECLRVHGVESEGASPRAAVEGAQEGRRRPVLLWVAVVIGVGGAGLATYLALGGKKAVTTKGGFAADSGLLESLRKQGIAEEEMVVPHAVSERIRAKAKGALGGKGTGQARADALLKVGMALANRAGRQGEDLLGKRMAQPAPKALEEVEAGGGKGLHRLEIVSILLAMAKSAKVPAAAFELGGRRVKKLKARAGPRGSPVALAVFESKVGEGDPLVVDLGEGKVRRKVNGRVLGDVAFVGHLYNLRGGHQFLQAEGAKANRASEIAIRLDPESPAIHATRAAVLLAFGQTKEALSLYRRAVELGKADAEWLLLLCLSQLRADESTEAEQSCKQAVEKAPDQVATQVASAYVFLAGGEIDKAKKFAEKARQIDDTDADVYKAQAQVHAAYREPEKAKAALERALRIDPNAKGAHLLLAMLAMQRMDVDEAVTHLRAEVKVEPYNERLRGMLASALFRSGKRKEAEQVLTEMRARSKDTTLTDKLVAQIRAQHKDDEGDEDEGKGKAKGDGGAEDDEDLKGGKYQLQMPGEKPKYQFFKLKP